MPVKDQKKTLQELAEISKWLQKGILICGKAFESDDQHGDSLMVVRTVRHSNLFPHCSTIVHNGGCGTTVAAARAGRPSLVLWVGADQPILDDRSNALESVQRANTR